MPLEQNAPLLDGYSWLPTALNLGIPQAKALLEQSSDSNPYTGPGVHAVALGKASLKEHISSAGNARQVTIEIRDLRCHPSLNNGKLPDMSLQLAKDAAFIFQNHVQGEKGAARLTRRASRFRKYQGKPVRLCLVAVPAKIEQLISPKGCQVLLGVHMVKNAAAIPNHAEREMDMWILKAPEGKATSNKHWHLQGNNQGGFKLRMESGAPLTLEHVLEDLAQKPSAGPS